MALSAASSRPRPITRTCPWGPSRGGSLELAAAAAAAFLDDSRLAAAAAASLDGSRLAPHHPNATIATSHRHHLGGHLQCIPVEPQETPQWSVSAGLSTPQRLLLSPSQTADPPPPLGQHFALGKGRMATRLQRYLIARAAPPASRRQRAALMPCSTLIWTALWRTVLTMNSAGRRRMMRLH